MMICYIQWWGGVWGNHMKTPFRASAAGPSQRHRMYTASLNYILDNCVMYGNVLTVLFVKFLHFLQVCWNKMRLSLIPFLIAISTVLAGNCIPFIYAYKMYIKYFSFKDICLQIYIAWLTTNDLRFQILNIFWFCWAKPLRTSLWGILLLCYCSL